MEDIGPDRLSFRIRIGNSVIVVSLGQPRHHSGRIRTLIALPSIRKARITCLLQKNGPSFRTIIGQLDLPIWDMHSGDLLIAREHGRYLLPRNRARADDKEETDRQKDSIEGIQDKDCLTSHCL